MPQKGINPYTLSFMVDTFKYHYSNYNPGIDFLNKIPSLIDVTGRHFYTNNEEVVTGTLDNLKVSIRKNSIKIENSLCKWYLGDNFQTLTCDQVRFANEKLSDTLHLNINVAKVLRLDIAENFYMQHSPKLYWEYLGKLNRYTRLPHSDGLYYRIKNKELLFYDKIKEQKAKGFPIPDSYQNTNILRYELRFLHGLSKTFNQEVTAKTLSDRVFYHNLLQVYSDMYFKIDKIKDINLSIGEMKGIKGMNNAGVALLINQFGENTILQQIKNDFAQGKISEKERRGMSYKINQLKSNCNLLIDSHLTKEFSFMIDSIMDIL